MTPNISIIAAIGRNRELGKNNRLLWHFPEDMKHFKEITSGHVVIMGRKTYESIGRLLPQRINIIISRNPDFKVNGAFIVNSLPDALSFAAKHEKEEIFIIGGAQIYELSMEFADKLYLTLVPGKYDADAFFPDYSQFKPISEKKSSDGKLTFIELAKEI